MNDPTPVLPPSAQPSPQTMQVFPVLDGAGTGWVCVMVHEASGTHCAFLNGDAAEAVGRKLIELAPVARTGLVVPGNGGGPAC